MQASHRSCFLIDERLHSQADAVHAALHQSFAHRLGKRARRALYGDFRAGLDGEILPNGDKDVFELCYIQESGSAAAEVDGIHRAIERTTPTQAKGGFERATLCVLSGMLDLGAQARNVLFEHRPGKDIGGEVAIRALRPAKRDGNVQSERHLYDYRLSVEQLAPWHLAVGPRASEVEQRNAADQMPIAK